MKKIKMALMVIVVLVLAMPAFATSTKVVPEPGYGVHDYTLRPDPSAEDIMYGSGLDIVYAKLSDSEDGHLTRCFLHVDATETGDKIQVNLYDYNGVFRVTLCEVNPPGGGWSAFPGCVKLDADKEYVWFSYSAYPNANDAFYKIQWDPDLVGYPVAPVDSVEMNCNWEIEWSTDPVSGGQGGRPFFAGLNSTDWNDPHSIWVDNGVPELQKVVEIGGNSSGFAFDNQGNLWSAAFTVGATESNKLFMWSAADVDEAADSLGTTVLQTDPVQPYGPEVILDLPGEAEAYFGSNDVECDPDGNVYVSCNLYADPYGHRVLKVENDGIFPWPVQDDMSTLANAITAGWSAGFRTLSYDGVANLDAGGVTDPSVLDQPTGNRLYLDLDYPVGSNEPDMVTGICVEDDDENDGVPDCLDNAYLTANGPLDGPYNFGRGHQYDTDNDMYGNICDCDVDNNNVVATGDLNILFGDWDSSGPDTDFDSNGVVATGDLNLFFGRWSQAAPFY